MGVLFLALAAVPAAPAGARRSHELSLLQAINATRIEHGLRPLHLDVHLEAAAHAWSAALLRSDSFTHGDFSTRLRSFGITGLAGENLAWGSGRYLGAQRVVAMWLASPGHRANLLGASYRRIGIGIARGTFRGSGASIVTADFAR